MIVIPNYVVKGDDGRGGRPDNSSMKHTYNQDKKKQATGKTTKEK